MVFRTKKVPETKQDKKDRQADRCNILVFVPVSLVLFYYIISIIDTIVGTWDNSGQYP